ncbi:glycosyltransferase family 2 protein [Chitinispirillales bacterium ANBcel5]|uniref:glycosyltransferase n=1 Tax=Cellulosispirillum alkaliphilum TaxID=3039283 RepID=UPI002A58CCC6|nr:glycosyltransferase family 2 protein [Chitinispirillales bacterium ANBcel5]
MINKKKLQYVLITPARNEAQYIEQTIKSMISQNTLPKKWVIVSDGSTDGTDEIVKKYASAHNWIELERMPEHRDRQFAAKVHSFNAGLKRLEGLKYDIIGNVDADVSFEPDFFNHLISKFSTHPTLGVAGAPFVEGSKKVYDHNFIDLSHVSGACQIFRRECFEQVGGYIPISGGGIDWAAVTSARMHGWMTRTFTEKVYYHHRQMGTGNQGLLMSRFKHGEKDYYLGGHPLWQVFRSCFQMTRKPYLVGGMFLLLGYTNGFLRRAKSPLPQELIDFHRQEQISRLKELLKRANASNKPTIK